MTIRDACGYCPHCLNRRVQCPIPFDELRWNRFGDLDARTALIDYDVDDHTVRDASCEHCHGREYRGGNLFRVAGMNDGIALGEQAAVAALPQLRAYQVSEADYAAWRARFAMPAPIAC